MKVLNIIIGILMAVFGIVCVFTPLKVSFGINSLIAVLALVYGIAGVIWGIRNKAFGIPFIFCILSVVFGICVFLLPSLTVVTNRLAARLAAFWMIAQGLVCIISAIQAKRITASGKWILQLICGIIGLLLGVYALLHPLLFGIYIAWILGILIGIYFIQAGPSVVFFTAKAE